MNKERGSVWVIILGVVMILFVIGFFRSQPSFWGAVSYKKILNIQCGLTVSHPDLKPGEKVAFPLLVDGYANGCGWEPAARAGLIPGQIAGTAQVFDGTGLPVTKPIPLAIGTDSTDAPFYFSAELPLYAAPASDSGYLLLKSNAGLVDTIPVAF